LSAELNRLPRDQIIPREAWDLAPWNRLTFQRVREFVPTTVVRRAANPSPLIDDLRDLVSIPFESDGLRSTVGEFLESSETDGFMILHRGRAAAEYYSNGMTARTPHLSQSVAKSIVGSVAGILTSRGMLDTAAPVTHYLPDLRETAYRGATVQHVLDMTSGVAWDETYTTPDSDCARIDAASGWKPAKDPTWPRCMWELVLTLTKADGPHGRIFSYRSIETDVLGFILQQVSGLPLAELVSQALWEPMGAEEDAYFTVDAAGFACGCGGFNATLRDYARFAWLWANNGRIAERQVLPESWIEATRTAPHSLFQGGYRNVLPQGGYHNQLWVEDENRRVLIARGVFGQLIYMDPEAEFAGVKLSSWPEFLNDAKTRKALAAMRAIRDSLR
jgi:CubicO group peptidase (beta-lactamase class C family)